MSFLSSIPPNWHPIASSRDLPFRHVLHGQLVGRELAVWRADDGNVNVWENRCLHRGVRLSIGVNDGAELKCQYHGWRYANRSAGCTYIPAHPANAPARRITSRTYPAIEWMGMIWTNNAGENDFQPSEAAQDHLVLRPLPVNAPLDAVLAGLEQVADPKRLVETSGSAIALTLNDDICAPAVFFVQPVDSSRSVIRGMVMDASHYAYEVLGNINRLLTQLRDVLELEASRRPELALIEPAFEPVSAELATMPEIRPGGAQTISARVTRKWSAAAEITGIEIAPLHGTLPAPQPGAHVDIHLANGLVRQYSIINGPGEWASYTLGVKRVPDGGGGSLAIADTLREGDLVSISPPRNNFPLRRDALKTILIAGGIGITPLLSMARALAHVRSNFVLHVFARSEAHVPFAEYLAALGGAVVLHIGLTPDATRQSIAVALGEYEFAHHVYTCGPPGFIELVQAQADRTGWPDDAFHSEFFSNDQPRDQSSTFIIELARSALTLTIPPGQTILEVMRQHGVDCQSSCEQGACGTCLTTVLDGIPDHQDVYLGRAEKAANRSIVTCVSRARTDRLVLDI